MAATSPHAVPTAGATAKAEEAARPGINVGAGDAMPSEQDGTWDHMI